MAIKIKKIYPLFTSQTFENSQQLSCLLSGMFDFGLRPDLIYPRAKTGDQIFAKIKLLLFASPDIQTITLKKVLVTEELKISFGNYSYNLSKKH